MSLQPAESLFYEMREEKGLAALRYLVEFLRSLQRAADSFELLELPRHHVRDYLRHLYLMKDWREMERRVKVLEMAVTTTLGKSLDELTLENRRSDS